jgi:hypothetical protein
MMHICSDLAINPLENGSSAKRELERFYMKNYFKNYIEMAMKPDTDFWVFIPDYKYYIMDMIIDHIDGLFTLPQLWFLYKANCCEDPRWNYEDIIDRQVNVIKYLDEYAIDEDDLDDIEIFKKNIKELSPIVFNILNDLIYDSGIFTDYTYYEGYTYPKMITDENECIKELNDINNACTSLEKIESICEKYHYIEDRVAALTKDCIDVRPCWVRSGGVNTEFYLPRKKEIRVQIAASKFKGKGNGKNKSALCAIIPMPKILSMNRN